MKKILFLLLFGNLVTYAQKELWGTNSGVDAPLQLGGYYGNITKTDIYGQNPTLIHEFDSINGYRPKGRLFQASNGKLYGTSERGGNTIQIGFDLYSSAGVLYEYDLILNKYKVVKYFDVTPTDSNGNQVGSIPPIGVLEPIIGQLYGATSNRIYKYDINTQTVTFYNKLPFNNRFGFELMKASDGNLYGTSLYSSCPNNFATQYQNGCVVKFNINTNTLSVSHPLHCDIVSEGFSPNSQLIEISPGKLIGTTFNGGSDPITIYASGTLFEYNFINNIFTKKKDFNNASGIYPLSLVNGNNGKIYGLCQEGGAPQTCNSVNNYGTLFEYIPATNAFEIKKYFSQCGDNVQYPKSLMKTSEGHFVGSSNYPGAFKWNPNTNIVTSNDYDPILPINAQINDNFIEICRKPSYQEFIVNTFSPAVGAAFTFNVNNTNAVTYVWKKGTTVLPTQTTGVLNFPNISSSDTGVYTCTMTNECGTTITANLNINVSNLSTETIDDYAAFIALYPNPTKGLLNLKFPENRGLKAIKYKITNLLGQVILENDISKSNKTELAIDTSGFANGVYQLMLITDKGNWNGKFVKE